MNFSALGRSSWSVTWMCQGQLYWVMAFGVRNQIKRHPWVDGPRPELQPRYLTPLTHSAHIRETRLTTHVYSAGVVRRRSGKVKGHSEWCSVNATCVTLHRLLNLRSPLSPCWWDEVHALFRGIRNKQDRFWEKENWSLNPHLHLNSKLFASLDLQTPW